MDQQNQDNSSESRDFCSSAKEDMRSRITAKHKEYKCSICHEKFFNLEEIRFHIRGMHLLKWTCQICDKTFANEDQYKNHCKFHVNFECEEIRSDRCEKESQQAILEESRESLAETLVRESKTLKCIFCDFTTTDSDTFNIHISSHATIDILQCSECGVCFDNKVQLEKHKVTHKKIYYQCGVCNTKFSRKKWIIKHLSCKHLISSKDYNYFYVNGYFRL